jgi:hypothetical protein
VRPGATGGHRLNGPGRAGRGGRGARRAPESGGVARASPGAAIGGAARAGGIRRPAGTLGERTAAAAARVTLSGPGGRRRGTVARCGARARASRAGLTGRSSHPRRRDYRPVGPGPRRDVVTWGVYSPPTWKTRVRWFQAHPGHTSTT